MFVKDAPSNSRPHDRRVPDVAQGVALLTFMTASESFGGVRLIHEQAPGLSLASESVVCTSAGNVEQIDHRPGYSPSIVSPVRCLTITAFATDFAAKWLFMNRYAFLTMARAAVAVSASGCSSSVE